MEASLILSILAIAGVGLTYWFLQEKIEKQKQRFRKRLEELEERQESRILEVMESAQVNYQVQLKQATEELKQQLESRLQETLKSLPQNSQTQPNPKTEELNKESEAQQQESINPLEEVDNNQIQQLTPLINQVSEETAIESEVNSGLKQEGIEPLTSEVQPESLEAPSINTFSTNFELEQEIRDPWSDGSEETQSTSLETSSVNTSEMMAEQTEEIVALSSGEETQPSPLENSSFSPSETNLELEEEIRAQSNQEIEQEIQQALQEIISVITEPVASDGTAQSLNATANTPAHDVAETIIAMGKSRQVSCIPKLCEYIHHPNTRIRGLAVSALSTIAASQPQKAEVQRVIPLLGKLSRASEPSVRQAAVEALANIKSETVIPFLKLALRDSDRNVVKAASIALNKFKFYPMAQATKLSKPSPKTLKR